MKKTTGKVILIPDNETVIIDLGKEVLSVGDSVEIYEVLQEIVHPDTQESLGDYEFRKNILYVYKVEDKFSICKKRVKNKSWSNVLSVTTNDNDYSFVSMPVNERDLANLVPTQSDISVGDLVKKQS